MTTKYAGRPVHEITADDVGKQFSRLPGCRDLYAWGAVAPADVGKLLVDNRGVIQLETAEQRDRRKSD